MSFCHFVFCHIDAKVLSIIFFFRKRLCNSFCNTELLSGVKDLYTLPLVSRHPSSSKKVAVRSFVMTVVLIKIKTNNSSKNLYY